MTKQSYDDIGRELSAAEFRGTVLAKLGYIEKSIDNNQLNIKLLCDENQKRKDWQEDMDSKLKFAVGVATFIGGVIVFLTERVITFFEKKL